MYSLFYIPATIHQQNKHTASGDKKTCNSQYLAVIHKAWQDVNTFRGSFSKISQLAPSSLNPDFPPPIGLTLLSKWREKGIYQIQHLFIKNALKSEYEIPKQDLQTHHLVNTLKGEHLSLRLRNREEILVKSKLLKGKIYTIYSALLDHHRFHLGIFGRKTCDVFLMKTS